MFILGEYKFSLCLASGHTQLTQDTQVTFRAPPPAPPPTPPPQPSQTQLNKFLLNIQQPRVVMSGKEWEVKLIIAQQCPLVNVTYFLLLPFLLDFESRSFLVKHSVSEMTHRHTTWPKILQSGWAV